MTPETLPKDSISHLIKKCKKDKNIMNKLTQPVTETEYKPLENIDYSFSFIEPFEDEIFSCLSSDINQAITHERTKFIKDIIKKSLLKFLHYDIVYTISPYIDLNINTLK